MTAGRSAACTVVHDSSVPDYLSSDGSVTDHLSSDGSVTDYRHAGCSDRARLLLNDRPGVGRSLSPARPPAALVDGYAATIGQQTPVGGHTELPGRVGTGDHVSARSIWRQIFGGTPPVR